MQTCDMILKRREMGCLTDEPDQYQYSLKKGVSICLLGFQRTCFLLLLPDNTTIHFKLYCHQLGKLNDSLNQNTTEQSS